MAKKGLTPHSSNSSSSTSSSSSSTSLSRNHESGGLTSDWQQQQIPTIFNHLPLPPPPPPPYICRLMLSSSLSSSSSASVSGSGAAMLQSISTQCERCYNEVQRIPVILLAEKEILCEIVRSVYEISLLLKSFMKESAEGGDSSLEGGKRRGGGSYGLYL